jgi:hypothetical protein
MDFGRAAAASFTMVAFTKLEHRKRHRRHPGLRMTGTDRTTAALHRINLPAFVLAAWSARLWSASAPSTENLIDGMTLDVTK